MNTPCLFGSMDHEGRVTIILAGHSTGRGWPTVVTGANQALSDARVSGKAEGALNAASGSYRREIGGWGIIWW